MSPPAALSIRWLSFSPAVMALFLFAIIHRSIQLWLLYPVMAESVQSDSYVMQLLPASVWREHFGAGLLYLQQSPPLPNILFGIITLFTDTPLQTAVVLVALQSLLVALITVLLFLFLLRLEIRDWLAFAISGIFLLSADQILMEYSAMGNFFYEQLATLLGLLTCHCALNLQLLARMDKPADVMMARQLLLLGVLTAALALTRASFSFFFVVVVVWLLLFLRPPRKWWATILFLIPVVSFQGGWAVKNALVHDHFSFATSTWGGANARTGDIRRQGEGPLIEWLETQPPICEEPWNSMVVDFPGPVFFLPRKEEMMAYPQPEAVRAQNRLMEESRGREVYFDTATIRHFSSCLQSIYFQYWLDNPLQVSGWLWRSYQMFLSPIREFLVQNPNPLSPVYTQAKYHLQPGLWLERALGQDWPGDFRWATIDLTKWPDIYQYQPVTVLALPVLPLLLHWVSVVSLHLLVLCCLCGRIGKQVLAGDRLERMEFPLILFFYLAALSSLVEFGENMRFRVAVEPVLWMALAMMISVLPVARRR